MNIWLLAVLVVLLAVMVFVTYCYAVHYKDSVDTGWARMADVAELLGLVVGTCGVGALIVYAIKTDLLYMQIGVCALMAAVVGIAIRIVIRKMLRPHV